MRKSLCFILHVCHGTSQPSGLLVTVWVWFPSPVPNPRIKFFSHVCASQEAESLLLTLCSLAKTQEFASVPEWVTCPVPALCPGMAWERSELCPGMCWQAVLEPSLPSVKECEGFLKGVVCSAQKERAGLGNWIKPQIKPCPSFGEALLCSTWGFFSLVLCSPLLYTHRCRFLVALAPKLVQLCAVHPGQFITGAAFSTWCCGTSQLRFLCETCHASSSPPMADCAWAFLRL